jgi:hypothetical protein
VRQTIIRIADGEELRRLVMPGRVAAGLASVGCSMRLARGPAGAYVELSGAAAVPLDEMCAPPDWLAGPFRALGAEAVYIYVVDPEDGLDVLVESPWLGEEVPEDPASAGRCRSGPRGLAELRAACVAGRAAELRRRFLADGRPPPSPEDAAAMVEAGMTAGPGIDPAVMTDERLRAAHAALRDEMARRGFGL